MTADSPTVERPGLRRATLFALYLVGGVLIFVLGNNYSDRLPTQGSLGYEWGQTLAFLLLAWVWRKGERARPFGKVAFGLFCASFANAFGLLVGNWLGRLLPMSSTAASLAINKLSECLAKVVPIVLLVLLSGDDLGSLFLKRGKLKEALRFGLISFVSFAALFAVIALVQSRGPARTGLTASGLSLAVLLPALPWILLFVLANGFMEELWFRGLSLGRLRPHLGTKGAVLATALVFASVHLGATYVAPIEQLAFALITFGLGLANGLAMLKTESIWGSALFHAGYDLIVVIPILVAQ